jgi:anti-anti-sigma regulatory factor
VAEKTTKKTAKKPVKKTTKKTKAKSVTQKITCAEVMDIASAAEFQAVLLKALASKQNVLLDASQVQRADAAALQLLSAFFQDANTQKKSVEWKAPSEAFCRSATLLGLTGMLSLEIHHN